MDPATPDPARHELASRRLVRAVAALALILAACGGDGDQGDAGGTPTAPTAPVTVAPAPADDATTDAPGDTTPADPPETTVAEAPPAADGPTAADFTLALADGGEFTLSEEPRPVYLVFWAEWCPTCRGELPKVAEISTDYADEVRFVAVAGRGDLAATTERAAQLFGDRFDWGLDDTVWDLYGVNYQPVTFLITGDGVVVEQWAGIADEAQLRERIEGLIAARR